MVGKRSDSKGEGGKEGGMDGETEEDFNPLSSSLRIIPIAIECYAMH